MNRTEKMSDLAKGKNSGNDKVVLKFITGFVILFIAVFMATSLGRYYVSPGKVFSVILSSLGIVGKILSKFFSIFGIEGSSYTPVDYNVIINIRIPRVIGAILVGISLAISGTAYQGIFRNVLVSPDLLGASNGACVGAALGILLGFHNIGVQVLAFVFGVIAVTLTLLIPKIIRKDNTIILVLSGIVISGFMASVIGLLKYVADPETQLADIVYWQLGSIAKVDYSKVFSIFPSIFVCSVVLVLMSWRINLISLGDNEAKTMGVNLKMERNVIIVCSTLLTASSVCICGTIGWIGLIIPHLSRLPVGNSNTRSLPFSAVISAIFLLIVDTLARTVSSGEIPLSILTGFIGTPFFIWLLIRREMII